MASGQPAPALAPELIRQSISLARFLAAGVRNWALYPAEHPAVQTSVERLTQSVGESTAGAAFTFGVTPQTLLVAGLPLPDEQPVAEAARLLHDHDILQITFLGAPGVDAIQALLKLLSTAAEDLRRDGGPAIAWEAAAVSSIDIAPKKRHSTTSLNLWSTVSSCLRASSSATNIAAWSCDKVIFSGSASISFSSSLWRSPPRFMVRRLRA